MNGTKKWYQSQTILASVAALLVAVGGFVAAKFGLDPVTVQSALTGILAALGIHGRVKATKTIKNDDETPKPKKNYPLSTNGFFTGIVFAGLLCLGACAPYTYEGRTSHTSIEGHGPNGTHVTVTVDKAGVCTVTGEASTLEVDVDTAMRICAAHAQCTWRTAK